MTLPASPPITMAQVRAEFGGTAGTTKLSAYVRGGAYVPNTAGNSGVPTSVPIRLNQLCGASATTPLSVTAAPATVNKIVTTPGGTTSSKTTATASGGSGTKTYLWTRVSGDTGISIVSSTSATTAFSATVNVTNPMFDAVFKCTVTDASGSADSNTVAVHIEYSP